MKEGDKGTFAGTMGAALGLHRKKEEEAAKGRKTEEPEEAKVKVKAKGSPDKVVEGLKKLIGEEEEEEAHEGESPLEKMGMQKG